MVSLVAALLLAQTSSSVTLTTRGESVEMLLKDLSKQTGVAMETTSQTRGNIVIVSVKEVPLDEFRTKLAEAVGATWRKDGSVLRLVRTTDMENAQKRVERAIRVQQMSACVGQLKAKLAKQPAFDDKVALGLATRYQAVYTKYKGHLGDSPGLEASMALEPEMPSGRLAIAAVSALTAEQLADLGPGDRIVYGTKPTAMQRQLPAAANPAILAYLGEMDTYVKSLKRQPDAENMLRWVDGADHDEIRQPAGVILSTECSPYNPSLTVRFKLYDDTGTINAQNSTLFPIPPAPKQGTQTLTANGSISLSEKAMRLAKGFDELNAGKTFLSDGVLIDQLTHLEQNDPLSYVAADGVLGVASGKNVIAELSDDASIETVFNSLDKDKKLNLASFSKYLNDGYQVAQTDKWLVVSPKDPVLTRAMRADRSIMGTFFRHSRENNGATIDDMAEFASKMPKRYSESIAPMLAFFVLPELNAGISDRNVELLRIFGRLTPDQRKELESTGQITVGSLSAASHADLNDLLYRADSPISISYRSTPGAPSNAKVKFKIDTEITVAVPNGAPSGATLQLNTNSYQAVLMDGGTSNFAPYDPLAPNSLAYMLASAEHADPTDKRAQVHLDKFRLCQARNIMLSLRLTENISLQTDGKEVRYDHKNGASVPYDKLPADFRKQVDEQLKSERSFAADRAKGKTAVPPPSY